MMVLVDIKDMLSGMEYDVQLVRGKKRWRVSMTGHHARGGMYEAAWQAVQSVSRGRGNGARCFMQVWHRPTSEACYMDGYKAKGVVYVWISSGITFQDKFCALEREGVKETIIEVQ